MLKTMNAHVAIGLLFLLLTIISFCHAAQSPVMDDEVAVQEEVRRRRLQRNDDEVAVDCPTNSVYHCNEPDRIYVIDPTVACDPETCLWVLSALSPFRQPYICRGVVVQPNMRVSDILEPCLWWQSLYGDAPTPTDEEDPQGEPQEEPLSAPLPAPLDDPALEDENEQFNSTKIFESSNSTVNNSTNSSESTDDLESTPDTNVTAPDETTEDDSAAPSQDNDEPNTTSTTTTLNFNTILITYFVTTMAEDRRVLLNNNYNNNNIQHPATLLRGGSSSRHLKSVWKDVDREQLLDLTVLHLLSFIPEAKSIVITLTVLQEESETTGSIVAATEALKGSVVFDTKSFMNMTSSLSLLDFNSSSSNAALDRRVKSAFQDELALKEYMSSIQASSDPILKRAVQVTLGLPRDPSTSGTGNSLVQEGEYVGSDNETSSLTDFEWNPLWIAILVGAGIGVFGLCTVGLYLLCAKRAHRRRIESGVVKASTTGSFTYGGHAEDDENSPHSANLGASPLGVVVMNRGSRNRRSGGTDRNFGGGGGRPSSPQSLASSTSRRDGRFLLADVTGESEDAMLADLHSECTSVYSYIEKSTVAGAESITTMQMMAMMEDDASIITPCPGTSSNYRPHGATPDTENNKRNPNNRMDLSSMWSVMDGLDAPAATAIQDQTDEESGEIEEFHDEEEEKKSESFDDDCTEAGAISAQVDHVKKVVTASKTKLMFSAEKEKTGQNNGIYIFDDDVSVVSEQDSKISQPREDPKIVDTAGRHDSPSNPNGSSIKVVGKADVDSENGDGCRLAFCDLSQVAEGSESSSRVSSSSEMSGKLDRKISMDKENALGGKMLMTGVDDSEIESDGEDDDDSLFMRPTLGLKTDGVSPSAGKTVLLSNENKLSTIKDELRIGPLARGGDQLTAKEKKHMFIMDRTAGGSFDDSSIRLPGNLNFHDFRDDMSLSTTGSTNGKLALASMASF